MEAITDGGPAYPCGGAEGATLRDYFAAMAMVRLTGADSDGQHSAETLAYCAYRIADAMLRAREAA